MGVTSVMTTPSAGHTFSVGEAAARVGLSTYTLRWYEQEGLVAPVGRDLRVAGEDLKMLNYKIDMYGRMECERG